MKPLIERMRAESLTRSMAAIGRWLAANPRHECIIRRGHVDSVWYVRLLSPQLTLIHRGATMSDALAQAATVIMAQEDE